MTDLEKNSCLETYLYLREKRGVATFSDLEKSINYTFSNKSMLAQALTHSSAAGDFNSTDTARAMGINLKWNERLEFLGDSVLCLVITTHLMSHPKGFSEGELSKIRAMLVSEGTLSKVAQKLDLGKFILFGKSESRSGGGKKESILADTFEALIAGIYLDGGFSASVAVINKVFGQKLNGDMEKLLKLDSKSLLQEVIQERYKEPPVYEVLSQSGPAHNRVFEVSVKVKKKVIGQGRGGTKKKASQEAAREAYYRLINEARVD